MLNDLIRIDKNVGKNVLDFSALGKDAPLIKSLIYYFCHSYQYNLFGFGMLDPQEFAKEFNFTANYLRSRHESPAQLRGFSDQEIAEMYALQEEQPEMRVWDSILENALWILKSTKINYRYGGKAFDTDGEKVYYSQVKSIQFLTELSVTFHKNNHGGREKVLYHYALDPSFVENLTNYYFKADHRSISLLRKPALDDLYVYLKNLRSSLKGADGTPGFSLLCELAHIQIKNPKQRKFKLNKCLEKIAEESDLKFTVSWVKEHPGVRYQYKPIIHFAADSPAEDSHEERNNIFYQKVIHELVQMYRRKHAFQVNEMGSELKFLAWCRQSTVDTEEKALAFQNAYFETWRTAIKASDFSVKKFLQQLTMVHSIADIYRIRWRYLE